MDAADCRLITGVAEWLFDEVLLDVRPKPADQIVVVLACHLAVCGRADGRDVVVDGMPWRTAGKSARYAGELVVPELYSTLLVVVNSSWCSSPSSSMSFFL